MPKSPQEAALVADFRQAHDSDLLDCKTTAAWLGHKPRWLAQKVARGEGPPSLRYARKLVFKKAEVLVWLNSQINLAIQNAPRDFSAQAQRLSEYLFPAQSRHEPLALHKSSGEQ